MSKSKNLCLVSLIIISTLIFQPNICFSQNAVDTTAKTLSKLKSHLNNGNNDSVFIEASILRSLSKSPDLLYYNAQSNYYLGRYYINIGNSDSSLYYFIISEKQFVVLKDTSNIGKANFFIGANYNYLYKPKEALLHFSKSAEYLVSAGDSVWISVVNNYIGITYFEIGDYSQALHHLYLSLNYLDTSGDLLNIGNTYNTIGNTYRKMNNTENEKDAYLKAIKILEQIPANNQLGMAYNNLAEVYFKLAKNKLGFETIEKAKNTYTTTNYTIGMCGYYAVLSYYYINTEPPDYYKVIEYSTKSREIADKYNDIRQFSDASQMLGNALFLSNQLKKAEKVGLEGYKAAKDNLLADEIVNNSLLLAQVYEKMNRPSEALHYYKINFQYQDSLYNKEKIKEFLSLDLNHKFTQKQISDSLRNAMQNEKTKLAYNANISTQKLYNYFYLIAIILVLIIAFFLYKSALRRKKANQLLRNQKNQITNQKIEIEKYANQINEALTKLKELDEFKQTATSMLVHDLKTPLNSLVNIEMFTDEHERLELVKYSSRQMLNLIMNLLDINRSDNNKIKPTIKNVILSDILNRSIEEAKFLAGQNSININIKMQNDYSFSADSELLVRVFTNVISNAIKFSPKNETITIDTSTVNLNLLRINIIDKGPGISKEDQQVIFKKYKQVTPKKLGSIHSSGLGLAFCKLAIEAHNWKIGVDSQEGKGACFWIDIQNFTLFKEHSNTDNTGYNIDKSQISGEDYLKLKPYLLQLEKLQVYAVSDIKNIISEIRADNISGLNSWIDQLLDSVSSFDNNKFVLLIKTLKK